MVWPSQAVRNQVRAGWEVNYLREETGAGGRGAGPILGLSHVMELSSPTREA